MFFSNQGLNAMSTIHDLNTRNFLRNLAKQDNSYFVTPWAGVILRNSDINGHLIEHTTIQSYIKSKTPYWILVLLEDDLTLVAVQSEGDVKLLFTLFQKEQAPFCSKCSTQKCKHFKQYTDFKKQNLNDSNHINESEVDNLEKRIMSNPPSVIMMMLNH